MEFRNWIELGILITVLITGGIVKYLTRRSCRKKDGFKGLNDAGPGQGWRLK